MTTTQTDWKKRLIKVEDLLIDASVELGVGLSNDIMSSAELAKGKVDKALSLLKGEK